VAHGEEDGVLEAVVAEQVLVEQQNPDVGRVPRRDKAHREEAALAAAAAAAGGIFARHPLPLPYLWVWVDDGDRVLVGIVGIGSPGGEGKEERAEEEEEEGGRRERGRRMLSFFFTFWDVGWIGSDGRYQC